MLKKYVLAALFTFGFFAWAVAAQEPNVQVTIKGILHEDKDGFFIHADGSVFDLSINDTSKADMHKFYTALNGDMVKVTGALVVEEVPNAKSRLIVFGNDIVRLKGEAAVLVTKEPVIVERPVIVRERYVERSRGINLPGIHINW